eukprot:Partr_v1_DN28407_c0_g1_i1_m41195 putative P4Hc
MENLFDTPTVEEELLLQELRARRLQEKRARLDSLQLDTLERRRLRYLDNSESRHAVRVLEGFAARSLCHQLCEYFQSFTAWKTDRHSSYATRDTAVEAIDCDLVKGAIQELCKRAVHAISEMFHFHEGDLEMLDAFVISYDASLEGADHLEMHTDGCLISFNLLLNPSHQFESGGTLFKLDNRLIRSQQGDLIVHDSKQEHAGVKITRGKRYLLVGFVDSRDAVKVKRSNNESGM